MTARKVDFKMVLLLQYEDECHVSLKTIEMTLHIEESVRERLSWLKA